MNPSGSITPHIASFCLIAAGAGVCATVGATLAKDKELRTPLNPFGINASPYGEVLAMAMQGTIDTYWHSGIEQAEGTRTEDDHDHGTDVHAGHDHDHYHDTVPPKHPTGVRGRMLGFLEWQAKVASERTNPKPASRAQTFNTRRQIEDKLRFAYQLDPAHYANYNSYHFFLTEPELGTHPKLTPQAAGLADRTIRYCLAKTDDPRPALTAAAATGNLLELMFNDRAAGKKNYSTATMREYLQLMDRCIAQYQQISSQWQADGQWNLLSPQRQLEADDRLTFITKVREASQGTILRLEQTEQATPNNPPSAQ